MKVEICIAFNDKVTKTAYKPGDVVEMTPARFNEIREKGKYVKLYVEPEKPATTDKGGKQ